MLGVVDERRLAVGNARLFERDGLAAATDALAGEGRTSVQVAIDGRPAAVIAMAGAARATSAAVVAALRDQGVRAVMLSGDSRATAERIAAELGINEAIAEVLPADEAAKVAELQMRSDPLVVAHAITIARGAVRKMHQDLAWAVGYNSLALPVAAAVFEPLGFVVRPEVGAI